MHCVSFLYLNTSSLYRYTLLLIIIVSSLHTPKYVVNDLNTPGVCVDWEQSSPVSVCELCGERLMFNSRVNGYNYWNKVPTTSRLIRFDPHKNVTEELIGGLHFANGVQLSPDEDFVLVAETTYPRILRYWDWGHLSRYNRMYYELVTWIYIFQKISIQYSMAVFSFFPIFAQNGSRGGWKMSWPISVDQEMILSTCHIWPDSH